MTAEHEPYRRCHACGALIADPHLDDGCPHCGVCFALAADGQPCGGPAGHDGDHAPAGWDRQWLQMLVTALPSATYNEPDLAQKYRFQLAALLADRDAARAEVHRLRTHRDLLQAAVDDWARTAGEDITGLVRAAQARPATATEEWHIHADETAPAQEPAATERWMCRGCGDHFGPADAADGDVPPWCAMCRKAGRADRLPVADPETTGTGVDRERVRHLLDHLDDPGVDLELTWPEVAAQVRALLDGWDHASAQLWALRDELAEALSEHRAVAGRCPGCGRETLLLAAGGHVTCARLGCPAPEAADELMRGGLEVLEDATCRLIWAAALRWAAGRWLCKTWLAEGLHDGGDDERARLAEWAGKIESGELSPWADEPSGKLPAVHDRRRQVWESNPAPGSWVCATCGMPTESEPCPQHGQETPEPDLPPALDPAGDAPTDTDPALELHTDPTAGCHCPRAAEAIRTRLAEAWPHLDQDPVFLDQVAHQAAAAVCIARGSRPASVGRVAHVGVRGQLAMARRLGDAALEGQARLARGELLEADEPDTPPHTSGILGRALEDSRGDLWREAPAALDQWIIPRHGDSMSRVEIQASPCGPVREVLLVDPAAGPVLDAAVQWHRARNLSMAVRSAYPDARPPYYGYAADALAAAVDALTGGPGSQPLGAG